MLKEEAVRAATQFNFRHTRYSGDARGLLSTLVTGSGEDVTSMKGSKRFDDSLNEVRRNRLWLVEHYGE